MVASFNVDSVRAAWQAQQQLIREAARVARQQAYAAQTATPAIGQDSEDESYDVPSMPPYCYIKELWTDFLIVDTEGQQRGDNLSKVPYTVGDDGDVSFGSPTSVKVEYVPLSADTAELLWRNPNGRATDKLTTLLKKAPHGAAFKV